MMGLPAEWKTNPMGRRHQDFEYEPLDLVKDDPRWNGKENGTPKMFADNCGEFVGRKHWDMLGTGEINKSLQAVEDVLPTRQELQMNYFTKVKKLRPDEVPGSRTSTARGSRPGSQQITVGTPQLAATLDVTFPSGKQTHPAWRPSSVKSMPSTASNEEAFPAAMRSQQRQISDVRQRPLPPPLTRAPFTAREGRGHAPRTSAWQMQQARGAATLRESGKRRRTSISWQKQVVVVDEQGETKRPIKSYARPTPPLGSQSLPVTPPLPRDYSERAVTAPSNAKRSQTHAPNPC